MATKAAGECRSRYVKDIRARRETTGSKLEVGDLVWVNDGHVDYRKSQGGSWVEVVEVEDTDRPAGKFKAGGDDYTPWQVSSWIRFVTLADGSRHEMGQNVVRRFGEIEKAPYVEEAWVSVPKKLQTARKVVLALMGQLR